MVPGPRPIWARYGAAIVSMASYFVLRWIAAEWFGENIPIGTLFFVILFSAWYGGFGPAVTAAALAMAISIATARGVRGSPGFRAQGFLLYWVFTLAIAAFGGMIARARQRIAQQFDELTRQREQLAATLRSIGDAVIVTDATGRICSLNPIAERLTAWDDAAARGQMLTDVFRIVHEESRQSVASPVERVISERAIVGLANHTLLIAHDGTERPIDDSAAPIHDASGRLAGIVLVFRDTTERRERERSLADDARRKDEFLALLAHELRNPLAPMASALQILQLSESESVSSREAREVAQRQLTQLTRLVDDLLDVSRIMRGKVELRRERLELSSVLAQAVETAQPTIDADRHTLTVIVPPQPIWIDADRVRITQVLSNLLSNAAKYTAPEGQIRLEAQGLGDQVTICVSDNGIGIEAAKLPHVFEMFMQVAPGAERSQGGLGIGLTLVKSLVELHGGHIEADSGGKNQGSRFTVYLPSVSAAPPAKAVPVSSPAASEAGPSRQILVVDDNIDAARSLAMLLRLRGHDVALAFGGEEALAAVRQRQPELIFLDIGMPGMDGLEVARRLRAEFDTTMVLVALTGWGTEQDRQKSREAGFDRHLTKPVDLAAVEAVLAECRLLGQGA